MIDKTLIFLKLFLHLQDVRKSETEHIWQEWTY